MSLGARWAVFNSTSTYLGLSLGAHYKLTTFWDGPWDGGKI